MEECRIGELEVNPYFELEDFMTLCQESRLDTPTMEKLLQCWEEWLKKLKANRIESGRESWLAVWLPEDVENLVDEHYSRSQKLGYLLNTLATYLCMAAVYDLLPMIAEGGCAPAPVIKPELRSALEKTGIASDKSALPDRRYSIVTYYPFKGGCEVCQSRELCPKINSNEQFTSMVLPGYERGIHD